MRPIPAGLKRTPEKSLLRDVKLFPIESDLAPRYIPGSLSKRASL
jgi:hypothetical protein